MSKPVDLDAVLQALLERVNALQKGLHKHDDAPEAIRRFLPFSDDEVNILHFWMQKVNVYYEFLSLYGVASNLVAELKIEKQRREDRRKESKHRKRKTQSQQATS